MRSVWCLSDFMLSFLVISGQYQLHPVTALGKKDLEIGTENAPRRSAFLLQWPSLEYWQTDSFFFLKLKSWRILSMHFRSKAWLNAAAGKTCIKQLGHGSTHPAKPTVTEDIQPEPVTLFTLHSFRAKSTWALPFSQLLQFARQPCFHSTTTCTAPPIKTQLTLGREIRHASGWTGQVKYVCW